MNPRHLLPTVMLLAASLGGCDRLGFGGGRDNSAHDTPTLDASVFLTIAFDGSVIVDASASTSKILDRVRHGTQSVMRGLLKKKISISSTAQVKVDVKSFQRETLQIVDAKGERKPALRVRFHYEAEAIAPESAVVYTEIQTGMLVIDDLSRAPKVIADCTQSTPHDQEFSKTPWYVFDVSLESCSRAILDEQRAIDKSRTDAGVVKPDEITPEEAARLYLPIHVKLLEKPLHSADDRRAANDTPASGDPNNPGSAKGGRGGPRGPGNSDPGSNDPTMHPPTDPDVKATADPAGDTPDSARLAAPKDKVPSDGFSFDYAAAGVQLNWLLVPFALLAAYLILRKGSNSA